MEMTRKEFIKKMAALGVSLPFMSMLLESCGKEEDLYEEFEVNFNGKVLIIGAGSAGLTAGYLLNRYNIDYEIIEASPTFGGRLKRADNFADFPIDLGAEWIHENPSVLARMISNESVNASIDIIPYSPETIYAYSDGELKKHNWASNFYSEYKFKSSTWFGFFEQFIAPASAGRLVYNSPVVQIDYSGNQVIVSNAAGETFQGDKVLVTVPIKILQNESINFTPQLPSVKIDAINSINMPDGIKVFVEFSEKFYPDLLMMHSLLGGDDSSEWLYYDAAFRKNANTHVLALFVVGFNATPYTSLDSDQEIIDKILAELDEIFEGKASQTYKQHIIQNWSKEPYIQGSYGIDYDEDETETTNKLKEPIDKKVYFAGEAMGADNAATVPGAAESAYDVIEGLLKNP